MMKKQLMEDIMTVLLRSLLHFEIFEFSVASPILIDKLK
jgi:hypothetical protein